MIEKLLHLIPQKLGSFMEKHLKKIPYVKNKIDVEINGVMKDLETSLKPYKDTFQSHTRLPQIPLKRDDILGQILEMNTREEDKWKQGYVSGAVYHGNKEHIEFLNKVYAVTSQINPLHSDLWPSASKFEAEIIEMTASMLSSKKTDDPICGTVTSGGTESILLAMKTYRDFARVKQNIKKPELIVPITAHAAFDKACQYFNIKMRHIRVNEYFQADISQVKKAVNKNTIAIVGSAPSFPHGTIDPIEEMSAIALEHNIGFHTDACLGGFVLPFAEKLGFDVPLFDFRLKGVTSISADTHKYGYAAKGTSVIMYRGEELRHFQYYTATDWPGGLYFSPTFAGSRPGALSAACWASLLSIGEKGYMDATRKIMDTADKIKQGINQIPELYILGKPLWVIAFGAKKLNIYRVLDEMTQKGWSLNGLHKPSCVHIAITLLHTSEGVCQRFIDDLKQAVEKVKTTPDTKKGMAPVYGMAATLPARGVVSDILKKYLDTYYKA
ncbi:MAG: aminotransferase class V-fold PLP-dependent enzyme [Proteobacteria bacterium]|nr:aminotransferase class V-fold PLP-dependent enzyme [Pseudomonadota bacterium]MBU1696343.1 aminotransferase class V-fold PLP-dependent enzyme [Pseudomonadota bacterium]